MPVFAMIAGSQLHGWWAVFPHEDGSNIEIRNENSRLNGVGMGIRAKTDSHRIDAAGTLRYRNVCA